MDFYKGIEIDGVIDAEIAVSMKTTVTTDVNKWLNSKPIQDKIKFLQQGMRSGFLSHNKRMSISKAEIHIYIPKENTSIKEDWLNILREKCPEIVFNIDVLEDFIK